jgi:hypothetical protein
MGKDQFNLEKLAQLCEEGDFSSFIRLLNRSFKRKDIEQWESLLDNLDKKSLDKLITGSIKEKQSISNVDIDIRGLRTKGLLDRLESKIGSANYIKLIKSSGTFFELIHILRYSTQSFADDIIDGLESDSTAELIEKAIAENLPVHYLPWGLALLKRLCDGFEEKFEQKIGVTNILRLVFTNGDLGLLSRLITTFTDTELKQL